MRYDRLAPSFRLRTILGSAAWRKLAIFRAMSVFPVPGGPQSTMPRTWLIPSSRRMCGGYTRLAKALTPSGVVEGSKVRRDKSVSQEESYSLPKRVPTCLKHVRASKC